MATIPDTPDIADRAEALGATEAATRLRALHQLGATDEVLTESLRTQLATAQGALDERTAERDTLTAERATLAAERDTLQAQLDVLAPNGVSLPVNEFRKRLLPLRLALLGATEDVRATWAVILPELDHFTMVEPLNQPVAGLIDLAEAQGLVTADQAAVLRQV